MKKTAAKKFIAKELKDLDVPKRSHAYELSFANAVEAAEIMTKAELKKYIVNYLDLLPAQLFYED